MIIAKIGNYVLENKTFVCEHKLTTHEICIANVDNDHGGYVIANFDEDGNIVSVGNRLLEEVIEDPTCTESIWTLAKIGISIMETDEVFIHYEDNE